MFAGMLAMIMLTNQSERWQGQQARSEEIQRNLDTLSVSPKINAILANRGSHSSSSDKPNRKRSVDVNIPPRLRALQPWPSQRGGRRSGSRERASGVPAGLSGQRRTTQADAVEQSLSQHRRSISHHCVLGPRWQRRLKPNHFCGVIDPNPTPPPGLASLTLNLFPTLFAPLLTQWAEFIFN